MDTMISNPVSTTSIWTKIQPDHRHPAPPKNQQGGRVALTHATLPFLVHRSDPPVQEGSEDHSPESVHWPTANRKRVFRPECPLAEAPKVPLKTVYRYPSHAFSELKHRGARLLLLEQETETDSLRIQNEDTMYRLLNIDRIHMLHSYSSIYGLASN